MTRMQMFPWLVLLAAGCAAQAETPPDPRPVVAVATVQDSVIGREVVAAGILGAVREVDLGFTVPGVLNEVSVRAGARVPRGAVLARLDPQSVRALLSGAEAALSKADRDLVRARRLHADSVIALAALQDAETAVTAAKAQVDAARFSARTAVIVAPEDGVVLSVVRDPGGVVGAGETVLRFAGTTGGSVFRAGLTDRDALAVAVGDEAEVRLDALPDQVFPGRVRERAGAPTAGTASWAAEVALAGVADLPRGLSGTVTIRTRGSVAVRLVPLSALLEADGARGALFIVAGDRAVRTPVTLGAIVGNRVIVTGGLESGSRVVTAGAAYLTDGALVSESAP